MASMKIALTAADLGHLIRDTRLALGKTQSDLADGLRVRRQTISDLEAGRNVGMHTMFAALAYLGKGVAITDVRPTVDTIASFLDDE